jgi:hypothetical protein
LNSVAPLLAALAAFGVGGAAYLWAERLGRGGALLALLRGTAGTLLALLLLDLTCARTGPGSRPLVLLDGSLSMDAAGGRGDEARDSAARWGEVRRFGIDPTGPDSAPGYGRSVLRTALIAAAAQDRPVIVVTDGAIEDRGELPPDLLARATVRLFPRAAIADAAVLRVDAPSTITLGDTLRLEVLVGGAGGISPKGALDLLGPTGRVIATRPLSLTDGELRSSLAVGTGALGAGDHLLGVRIRAPGDAEPHDDLRQILVRVTALPGAVLLAAPPDWDARQLYATLRDVAALPVKGFVRLGPAGWRAMDGLRHVTSDDVARATRGASLVVLKGAPDALPSGVHPRGLWRWPSGEGGETSIEGDWYAVTGQGLSPLAGAFTGVAVESLPPLARLTPIEPDPNGWTGFTAQQGRRGPPRPVIVGRDSAGIRVLTVAADGLWRWAFRPGSGEEAYRQVIAAAVDWSLGGADSTTGGAVPLRRVVPLGAPLIFQRTDTTLTGTESIAFSGDSVARVDTLRFDGAGRGEVRLPPGRYAYRLARGGHGVVAVEPWSAEYVPKIPGLGSRVAGAQASIARAALRDSWWVYALIVTLVSVEWWLRRRAGLR